MHSAIREIQSSLLALLVLVLTAFAAPANGPLGNRAAAQDAQWIWSPAQEREAPAVDSPATLATAVLKLPAAARDRVLALGDRLRTLLATLHREHRVLVAAAGALAAHMDGLMRQIGRRLSHAGTYGRPGQGPGVPVMTVLDMTS